MSSSYVRGKIKDFLGDNSNETVVDLTATFEDFKQMLADAGVQPDAPWLGIQFIGGEEVPVALAATNDQGMYREFGGFYIHVADVARIGGGDSLLTRGETLRNLFRGSRIEDIVIESMTTMNFDVGATLEFEGGYVSGSFLVSYYRDLNLGG